MCKIWKEKLQFDMKLRRLTNKVMRKNQISENEGLVMAEATMILREGISLEKRAEQRVREQSMKAVNKKGKYRMWIELKPSDRARRGHERILRERQEKLEKSEE